MSNRKKYIKSCEISEIVTVRLCGFEQKILIEGKLKNLPVVNRYRYAEDISL